MIYFIMQDNQYVKIGYSGTDEGVNRRLSALQTGNPANLSLYSTEHGDEDRERQLHKRFKDSRIRGEWFNLTQDIRDHCRPPLSYQMDSLLFWTLADTQPSY